MTVNGDAGKGITLVEIPRLTHVNPGGYVFVTKPLQACDRSVSLREDDAPTLNV
jgi:hypothetical protein